MIMRATSSAPATPQGMAGQSSARHHLAERLSTTLIRWGTAYLTWRMRTAATLLWSMRDREFRDIGLNYSEIEGAVRAKVRATDASLF